MALYWFWITINCQTCLRLAEYNHYKQDRCKITYLQNDGSLLILNYSYCMPVDNRNGPFIIMVKATSHKATKTVDDKIFFSPSCFQVLHVG